MRRAINIAVSVLISVIFVLLGVFVFSASYLRFWETLKEFGQSVAFYFCEIFGIEHGIVPTVNASSRVVENMLKLPDNLDGFKENLSTAQTICKRIRLFFKRTRLDLAVLGCRVGVSLQPRVHSHGLILPCPSI